AVPEGPPVPDLPVAAPGETVGADGSSAPGAPAAPAADEVATTGSATNEVAGPDEPVVVSVVGLVGRSGLVTVAPGARVADALDHAGGVLDGGDRDGLNLARKVVDGEQILVGLAPGPDGPRGPRSGIVGAGDPPVDGGPAPASAPAAGAAPGSPPAPGGGLVDLNTADATALETLPGVGPVTASSILAWRAANGAFASIDQLAEVDGIGPVTLARLRPLVTV
ncbi:MAG: ComEA family DNA-binding protein, partial [Dietzia cercidiphylli]